LQRISTEVENGLKNPARVLEKELMRHVRQSQNGAARATFKESSRPEWWVPSEVIQLENDHDFSVIVPEFKSNRDGNWSVKLMRALIALAIQDEEGIDENKEEFFDTKGSSSPVLEESRDDFDKNVKENVRTQCQDEPNEQTRKRSRKSEDLKKISIDKNSFKNEENVEPKALQVDEELEERKRKVESIIDELDIEVDARCAELKSLAKSAAFSVKNMFRVQMMKIPKKVRALTLNDFQKQYGGDIDAVLLKDIETSVANIYEASGRKPTAVKRTIREIPEPQSIVYTARNLKNSKPNMELKAEKENSLPVREKHSIKSANIGQKRGFGDSLANQLDVVRSRGDTRIKIVNEKDFESDEEPEVPALSYDAVSKVQQKQISIQNNAQLDRSEQLSKLAQLQRQVADMMAALAAQP